MPSYKKNRLHWLINLMGSATYTPLEVSNEMKKSFVFVGQPTKGGTVERARRLLTQAKKIGWVKDFERGIWALTELGHERRLIKDDRTFHGKVSGHTKVN